MKNVFASFPPDSFYYEDIICSLWKIFWAKFRSFPGVKISCSLLTCMGARGLDVCLSIYSTSTDWILSATLGIDVRKVKQIYSLLWKAHRLLEKHSGNHNTEWPVPHWRPGQIQHENTEESLSQEFKGDIRMDVPNRKGRRMFQAKRTQNS